MEMDMRNFFCWFHYPRGKQVRLPHMLLQKWGHAFTDGVRLIDRYHRIWEIKLEKRNNEAWLGAQWSDFKRANGISFRDSVYFMYKEDNFFCVVVFGMDGLEKVRRLKGKQTGHIFFYKRLATRTYDQKMVLPDAFTTNFGNMLVNPIKLFGKNVHSSTLNWTANPTMDTFVFEDGWDAFVGQNNIKRGSFLVCKFDFSHKIRVEVVDRDSGSLDQFHTGFKLDPWDINQHVCPLWSVKLTEGSAKKGRPLYVPARVVKNNFVGNENEICVRFSNGQFEKWNVIWSEGRKECKLGRGWYEFKEKNNLKEGDVVKFGRRGLQDFFRVDIN